MINRFFALFALLNLLSACGIQIQNQDTNQEGPYCSLIGVSALAIDVSLPSQLSSPDGVEIRIEDGAYNEVATWNSAQARSYPEWSEQYMDKIQINGSETWANFRYDTEYKILFLSTAISRPGTYKVSVSHPNYSTVVQSNIVVISDECNVVTQDVSLSLQ